MEKQARRTTQMHEGNYPSVIDLNQARAQFAAQLAVFEQENPKQVKEKMQEADAFYSSATGYFELRNVMAGKASLGPTIRALNTLKTLSQPKTDPATAKRLKRQGLTKAALGMEVIGCMHYPEPIDTATIIGSGLIIGIIVTIAAFWWADYKRGTFNRQRP